MERRIAWPFLRSTKGLDFTNISPNDDELKMLLLKLRIEDVAAKVENWDWRRIV